MTDQTLHETWRPPLPDQPLVTISGPAPEVIFHDSTDPAVIPDRRYAALYFDGEFGPAGQAARPLFRHKRWITYAADYVHCGIVDYEPGNPSYDDPQLVTAFLAGRARMARRARIYSDMSDIPIVFPFIRGLPHEWWIAAWTGPNGEPNGGLAWEPEDLAEHIANTYLCHIAPESIWAIQGANGPLYDTSKLCPGRSW